MTDTMPQIGGAPYRTPNVRRKLPAPFMRARIDLDGGRRVRRVWKDINVTEVKAGDTIANFGLVSEVVEFIEIENSDGLYPWRIRLHNVAGDYEDFPGEHQVFAFAPDTGDE